MTETLQAHAIDITRCVECPYGADSATQPEAKTAQCTHPLRMAGEQLKVALEQPPPANCPHRAKMTVLRVIVPPLKRRERRHLRSMH